MPKTKISEYSTTNADNTDIESINIAEGCAPSGINNAIRELMVHLKEFQTGASGDGFTFAGGTLMTGTNTLSGTNVLSGSTTAAFAAGTVSAPSIAAHGDTNTGIFFPAADTIAFAEGGAEAMRINSSGNVGIGTDSPSFSVDVVRSGGDAQLRLMSQATGTNGIIFRNNAVPTSAKGAILYPNGSAVGGDTMQFVVDAAERMRIDSSGNVGIGTSSPSQKLHVQSTSNAQGLFKTTGAGGGSNRASVILEGPSNTWYINTNGSDLNGADASLGFYGNSATRMVIDSSGNVQIGTSSGSFTNGSGLIIANSTAARLKLADSDSGVGAADGFELIAAGSDSYVYNYENGFMSFGTAATERARITSGGYFKASDNSSYWSVDSGYHEFNQSANRSTLLSYNSNTGFSGEALFIGIAKRSASSAYSFTYLYSGDAVDLEFDLRGNGNGYADGTWNNNGADYAEFFESANGQALTLGATVVLEGTKVREATAQDDPKNIIGVVRPKEPSKASMVVGNTAWNKWANKYLTDDFDRYIMEDHDVVEWEEQVLEREAVAAVEAVVDEEGNEVSAAIPAQEAVYKTVKHSYESHNIPAGITVPADAVRKTHDDKGNKFQHYKLNPAWDKDAEYTPREKRPEWNIIGLLGQVKILKGQPVSDRWIKMRDVSATVEEWMIR